MKSFYNLTEAEKVSLTSEQVTYYTKLECANRGIIIPQKPINRVKDVALPTQKYYKVGYESFVFETEQDAQDYVDAKAKSYTVKTIGSIYDSKNQYVSDKMLDRSDISTITLYSKEEGVDLKNILEYNSETQKEWNTYNEALVDFNNIERDIWDEITEIKFKNSRVEFYNNVFKDYLELANNDEVIATTFFEKAYKTANLADLDREIVDKMLKEDLIIEHQG